MGVYLGSTQVDMQGGFVTGGASGASLQSKTVSPSESAQTIKADYGYDGLSQVTVNAVSRTYVGSGVTKKSAATYTPGTSDQSIASGQYLNGTQTIKGDSNLTAGNIRNGVKIFNVTGSYAGSSSSGGTDTSDATATAKDITRGKTAYVQGKKVTGELLEYLAGETLRYSTSGSKNVTFNRGSDSDRVSIKIHCFGEENIMRSNSYIELGADAILFGDATAADVAKGKTFTSTAGLKVTGTAEPTESNNNVEAYAITNTNPSVSFKRTDGAIKIWGYGTMTSQGGWGQQTTSLVAFEGDKYHKGAIYGGPSSTNLSLSISNGKLTGLPSGLSAISAIVTRGI
jgi:hypothetical protein